MNVRIPSQGRPDLRANLDVTRSIDQKAATYLHKPSTFLDVDQMRSVVKGDPFDAGDVLEPRRHGNILNLIIAPIDEENICLDLMRILPALPVLEAANNCKFGWAQP